VPPPTADDPVVAQAREALVTQHPEGARVTGVAFPPGASRGARIEALLAALGDPSTRLLSPGAWLAFGAELSGGPIVGVGLRELLDLDLGHDGKLVVITTQPGGPATRGGLAPGDVLEGVDGQPVRTLGEAMARLRGAEGSEVRLALRRGARHER
jgi:C-terminal processing protease CtpA/Prc